MIRRYGREAIAQLVAAQGVDRPFRILLQMPESSRMALARLLGCTLLPGDAAEVQAWRLINQNLRGLQARTHRLHETLSPFARNNNWWEIVTRTAQSLGLRFYPGMKDEEVERLLFDHLASEFVRLHVPQGDDPEQFLAELHPNLNRAIASLGLSRTGTQLLVATLLRAAAEAGSSTEASTPGNVVAVADRAGDAREGQNRLTDWLRRAMPWTWTTSICLGLRLLQQRLGGIFESWTHQGEPSFWRRNYAKVGTALMVIHLHDVFERTLEQFDVVGT